MLVDPALTIKVDVVLDSAAVRVSSKKMLSMVKSPNIMRITLLPSATTKVLKSILTPMVKNTGSNAWNPKKLLKKLLELPYTALKFPEAVLVSPITQGTAATLRSHQLLRVSFSKTQDHRECANALVAI